MTITIEFHANYGNRAVDDTGRRWTFPAQPDGSAHRDADGKVRFPSLYQTKAPGADKFRRLSKAQAERIAPALQAALQSYLAAGGGAS